MRAHSAKLVKVFAPALLLAAMMALPSVAWAARDIGFAVDGYLSGYSGDCMVLRDHNGSTRLLTGNLDGLQSGDHVRLYGQAVNGAACNNWRGNAYVVTEVLTLWGDDRHRTTLFDHLTDGSYDNYVNRQSGYGRYDDRYDRSGRPVVSLHGRLRDTRGGCAALAADDGRLYYLVGDLSGFRNGARAQVIGWTNADSRCGDPAIEVREIDR